MIEISTDSAPGPDGIPVVVLKETKSVPTELCSMQ